MKTAVVLFFAFFVLYVLTMGGHLYSPDEEVIFRTTQSLALRGSLAVEPLAEFATKRGIDGREYAQYGIGQPVLSIPLYYFGTLLTRIIPSPVVHRFQWDTTQYNDRSLDAILLRFGVSLFNQFIMALLVVVLYAFCYYLTRDRIASLLAAIMFGCGTMAWVHSKTYFSEPLAALCTLSAFFLLYKGLREHRPVLLLFAGTLAGYGVLTRLDTLLTIPGFLLLIVLENWATFRKHIGAQAARPLQFIRAQYATGDSLRAYSFFLPIVVILLLIVMLNKMRFGYFLATGYEDQAEGLRFSTPLLAGLYGYLFSVGKGVFFFSPVLVLFFFAIKKFTHEFRNAAIALLTIILVFLLVHATWQNWTGGWCWGPRHIFLVHAFVAMPIVAFLTTPRSAAVRIVYLVLLLVGIAVQLYGASQNFIDYYIEFYRTPQKPPNCYALYSPDDTIMLDQSYVLLGRSDENQPPLGIPLWALIAPPNDSIYIPQNSQWATYAMMLGNRKHDFLLIAPLNDSIYVPQNSQWSAYAVMLRQGKHDFFWLHFLFPKAETPK